MKWYKNITILVTILYTLIFSFSCTIRPAKDVPSITKAQPTPIPTPTPEIRAKYDEAKWDEDKFVNE